MIRYLIAALAIAPTVSAAAKLSCYVDERTDRHMCYSPAEVREEKGIRTTPFYMGGPKGANRTPYTLAVNCSTQVMHLKDSKGVSFAGGDSLDGTSASRALTRWICEEKIASRKKPGN